MSYHGGVRDSIKSIAESQEDKEGLRKARMRHAFKKYRKKLTQPFEEKMKNPAYAAAVELNRRHGIGPPDGNIAKGQFVRGRRGFPKQSGGNLRLKHMKVSLPQIDMDEKRETSAMVTARKAKERDAAEQRLVELVRDFVAAAQFNLRELQEVESTYLNDRQARHLNVLQLHNVLFTLTHKAGIKFTPEEMDFSRKLEMDTGRLDKRAANPASQYKNRYKKKRFVSLPEITMPMGEEE